MTLSISIRRIDGEIVASETGDDMVSLVYPYEYQEGDVIVLETSKANTHLICQIDDTLGQNQIYIADKYLTYHIPFGEKRRSYSPRAFYGPVHYLYLRTATNDEILSYRNLARNTMDQHENNTSYPHVSANVETRGESVFAARNAIDGIIENRSHGDWPYSSWGINCDPNACLHLDFGRLAEIDTILLYTRSDFPHDNWWKQVTFNFSDGSIYTVNLQKSDKAHVINFPKKKVQWLTMDKLIKSDDPSPFPALSQIEVYGTVLNLN